MALRFWNSSKSVSAASNVQLDDLAWFENSVQGGVMILGIFRDAIAMSPSPYVKQIAETTLSIIKAVAIAAIGDTGTLRINLQKLGEATAAVTATILQSYLESENRDGWPGSQLQAILEDLTKTLDTIELWVSSGQARNTMGRRKCVKMVKQFQERLSEVLDRFELASLLRSYTVFPFIKKMIEDYSIRLEAGAAKWQSSMTVEVSKASPGSEMVEQDINADLKQQKYRMEKETHDALRIKVQLMLRIIENEERKQHTSRENQISTSPSHQEFEKERQVSQRDQPQVSGGNLIPEADNLGGDHDNMEQDAVEMLYDMLMARLSNVAIPASGPKLLSPTLEQPNFSLPSPLPPSYTSTNGLSQSTPSDQLSLEKSLPSTELLDTSRPRKFSQAREVGHAYGLSKPFNHVKQGIKSRGCPSLPPGAMPPIISTASLISILTSGSGRMDSRPLTPVSIRPERSLSVTPLPNIEEEVERGETPLGSEEEERKPMAPLLPLRIPENSRPSLSADLDQEARSTNSNQRALDVILPVPKPTPGDDTGKDKALVRPLDATQISDALPGSIPFLPAPIRPGAIKMPNGSPPLPPGAMPPKVGSWAPPSSSSSSSSSPGQGELVIVPLSHRPASAGPPLNSIPLSSSSTTTTTTNANEKLLPATQSSSSPSRQPGLTLNDSSLRTTNSGLENKEEPINYHLPPITIPSPLSLVPLIVDSESSQIPLLPPPPPPPPPLKRPVHFGPGEHLRKMSPHMQRYVERLADRIWGGGEWGR